MPRVGTPGPRLAKFLRQAIPNARLFQHWEERSGLILAEETSTFAAGCHAVIDELSTLAEFTGAHANDVAQCREFYQQLGELAEAKLQMMEGQFKLESSDVQNRLVKKIVSDLEMQSVRQLASAGEIPDEVAESLERELKLELATKNRV